MTNKMREEIKLRLGCIDQLKWSIDRFSLSNLVVLYLESLPGPCGCFIWRASRDRRLIPLKQKDVSGIGSLIAP